MIVNYSRDVLTLMFAMEGSIVPAISHKIFAAFLLGIAACLLEKDPYEYDLQYGISIVYCLCCNKLIMLFIFSDFTPFTAFGVALSLFLGFRNNAAYGRWWEARQQWGKQIITVRNLGRIMSTLAPGHSCSRRIMNYASAHSHAMRNQLRSEDGAIDDRNSFLSKEEIKILSSCPNPADRILYFANDALRELMMEVNKNRCPHSPTVELSHVVDSTDVDVKVSELDDKSPDTAAKHAGVVMMDSIQMMGVHKHITEMGWVQGACERLEATPVPFPYALLVHRTTCLYCLMAPFAMVRSCGWFTPVVMAIIAYVFFGLDEVSHHLAIPFSDNSQSMPLTAMCNTIDISTRMAIGVDPPERIARTNYIVM